MFTYLSTLFTLLIIYNCVHPVFYHQTFSERMVTTRLESDRVNHNSGKMPYGERVDQYIEERNIAPFIATLEEVYKKDSRGSKMVVY